MLKKEMESCIIIIGARHTTKTPDDDVAVDWYTKLHTVDYGGHGSSLEYQLGAFWISFKIKSWSIQADLFYITFHMSVLVSVHNFFLIRWTNRITIFW